ncbi:RagB/SusD family nutrient uptake outer membrane protein [Phocaeicola plebeius]|nr:RagB/SusD family nutrient uptake outer membrane protein [Phocaeicola plebeius]
MRLIKLYTACICFSLGMLSCTDFLEEENRSNINSQEYFVEKDGFESLVNAAYASLRTVWKNEPWLFCLGVDIYTRGESELISGSYGNRDVYSRELNEYGSLQAQNEFVSNFYSNVYYAIQVCNTAISKSSSVVGLSEDVKKQRVAEVRFLRAYYYYLLVEQFGRIAIVTDEIETPVLSFPQKNEQEVYDFILSELDAIDDDVLPEVQNDYGRITQGAVKHLQALIYLTRGYKDFASSDDFSKAATLCDEIIDGDTYKLQPTFADVFKAGNEKNNEIIFSVQYDASSLGGQYNGNGQQNLFGFELWTKVVSGFERGNTTYGWKKNQFMCTPFLFSLFDTSMDSRYDATFKSEFYATIADPSIGLKVGDLRVYFPKYDQPFTDDDLSALLSEHPNAIVVTKDHWTQDIENIGGSGMCPMVWMFYDPNSTFPLNNTSYTSTKDIFLFRLADTYLMAAEAYYQMGDTKHAAERLNSVRQRAAIAGHDTEMTITPSDVNIDFILDERARELVGEYKRWMDLKRTGKLIERTLAHNNLAARDNKMDEHILVRPIPQSVIDQTDGEIVQNPGY